jgi:NAD(P)H dehydrogenase (quinone)
MARIAVTGATGVVGGAVARLLSDRGLATRLVVRQPARAPALPGTEVRRASAYGARDEMEAALAGCDTLCLIPAEESADRVTQHRTAVDAAVAAGVRRIVYLSIVNPAPDATFTLARDHWATEQHVRAAGVAHAFARMNLYLDFMPMMAGADGAIRGPAGEGRGAFVSRADVAAVTAAIVAGDDGDGQAHDITGREALTLGEVASALAAASGKRIEYVDETPGQARASRASYGAPDWQVEAWISTYTAIAAGELAAVSDTVQRVTGRPAQTLAEFLAAHPDALAHVH